jgi:hypothetical protein
MDAGPFGRLAALFIVSVILGGVSCNSRTPVLDNAVIATAPTPWTIPVAVPPTTPSAIELEPTGTMGGGAGRGTVYFDAPVQEATTVMLSTSDPAVTLRPTEVAVSPGAMAIDFSYSTVPVAIDKNVTIVASILGRARSAPLGVWAVLPMFFSYTADRGSPIGGARTGRYTPETAQFSADCRNSSITTLVNPLPGDNRLSWFITLAAPANQPLRPGVYENASNTIGGNFLSAVDLPLSCRLVGRFTVHEVDVDVRGLVNRLWVTFEETCAGQPGVIRGELRLTNPRHLQTSFGPCLK